MLKDNKKILYKKLLIFIVIFIFILFLLLSISTLVFELYYKNKIYPGVKIGNIDFSGLTRESAHNVLNRKIRILNQEGVNFIYKKEEVNITPVVSSFSGGLAYRVLVFKNDDIIDNAFLFGRNSSFLKNIKNQINGVLYGHEIEAKFDINEKEIIKILKNNYQNYETSMQNASLIVTTDVPYKTLVVKIKKEQEGVAIDYKKGISLFENNLKSLDTKDINLFSNVAYPIILKDDCVDMQREATLILNNAPITLVATSSFWSDKKWVIEKKDIAKWLRFKENKGKITIELNNEQIKNYFVLNIIPETDIAPVDARFEIKNGKVQKFQTSKDGIKLNINKSIEKIASNIIDIKKNSIALVLDKIESRTKTDQANKLGIKEIIGTGHSTFTGSSWSRKHNIKVGAETLNGLLIKPGEEFSLVKTLGDISSSTNYLPELVIKGNKTIPEYGGGLCQVGTTLFRTVLNAGLKVLERRNHSYRVSYYEPAGTDATIYSPKPDFKFLNDTENYILIQYSMIGNDLSFMFWGTNDGRVASTTYPVIYNIVKPEPTKEIETEDLLPGERKCTERAHNGADAYFDYIVTYNDKTTRERTFYSHYIPWREVCLVGVEKKSTSTNEQIN